MRYIQQACLLAILALPSMAPLAANAPGMGMGYASAAASPGTMADGIKGAAAPSMDEHEHGCLHAGQAAAACEDHHHAHAHPQGEADERAQQAAASQLDFIENRGQWPEAVCHAASVPGGRVYLQNDGFTWNFVDPGSLHDAHQSASPVPRAVRGHAFRTRFLPSPGSASEPVAANAARGLDPKDHHVNFYYGSDPSGWASRVPVYGGVRLQALYPGVDLRVYAEGQTFKYDLELAADVDPAGIRLLYEGLDGMALVDGNLELQTSVNRLVEMAPYAYQPNAQGGQVPVPCAYVLQGDTLSFDFPQGYDAERPLIIDPPTLIFGSYSGSMDDNWGYTATYDQDGALYGGGVAFGANYPTTLGAYGTTWGGGVGSYPCDIAISKFSPDGSTLEYSTFLGGSGNDVPHSMVCTPSGELWLYGTTGSSDFPTTPGCYDNSFGGGNPTTVTNVIQFPIGTDMFVTKLSADGAALVGSTYLGGSNNDGLNISPATAYNYGDHARGEIIADRNGFAYVASTTLSADFPTTAGALQTSFGGSQDGTITKLSPDLSALEFSTFIGGTGVDAAYSMKLPPFGSLVVGGGTTSSDFPTTPGVYQTSFQGGLADGWVARIGTSGNNLLESTYIGTADYDQVYFVELDADRDVYITGQSIGAFPVSAGTYSNPGSSQFLAKMEGGLTGFQYSTVFGSGINRVNIRPTAMLVDKCENVYISGWGGITNSSHNANVANTFGLPVTPDATQSSTDGSDFYFIVFEREATDLLYATYFGGNISREHVDGGTSRFDNQGIIYQAVCAGCGGHDDFPTTPGVWSNTNNSSNCNLGVIKYRFDFEEIEAGASAFPDSIGCVDLPVTFQNHSQNAVDYFWDFGDGTTSTDFEPFHLYTDTGVYTVMHVAIDSSKCIPADTVYLTIRALVPIDTTYDNASICLGESIFLGGAFQTTPGVYTDVYTSRFGCDSTVITTLDVRSTYFDTTFASVCTGDSVFWYGNWLTSTGLYTQTFGTAGGCDSSFTLDLLVNTEAFSFQTLRICDGDSVFWNGAWQSSPGTFTDTVSVPGGCDTIRVRTLELIRYDVLDSVELCLGDSVFAGGGWQQAAGSFVDSLSSFQGCDSVVTTVITLLLPDSIDALASICDGDSLLLGGTWQQSGGVFVDVFTNAQGCDSVVTTTLSILPVPYAFDTVYACPGDPVLANTGPGGGTFIDTLAAANGCDSLVEVFVVALPNAVGSDSLVICANDSIWLDGWQNTAGTYSNTLVAANGCDSIVSVVLTVLDTVAAISTVEICAGDSAFVMGGWVNSSGIYADTFAAANGCDSIVGVQLIVRPRYDLALTARICAGDSVFLGGAWQSLPGTYTDSLTSAFGCDSVVQTTLDTVPIPRVRVDRGLCPGDSLFLGGVWLSPPANYSDTLTASSGCDSVVYGDLFLYPVPVVDVNAALCVGDSIFLGGAWQNSGGTYSDTLVSALGCDSIVRTTVGVLPTASSFPNASICLGDSVAFAVGASVQWIDAPGVYVDTFPAANGCDSVVTLTVSVGGSLVVPAPINLCAGDSVFAGGAWQNTAGVYVDSFTAGGGCDSIVQTTVQLLPSYRDTTEVVLCNGDSVFVGGAWQSLPGTYTDFGTTVQGCDSIRSYAVRIALPVTTAQSIEICAGDSALIGGSWETGAGVYTDSLLSAEGCDSVVSTTLVVRPAFTVVQDTAICFGDSLFAAGAWRSTSGIYRDTLSTVFGCDSIVRVDLTVLPVNTSVVDLVLCSGDSVFVGGAWQQSAGTYLDVLTSSLGCDSVRQTNLSFLPAPTANVSLNLCAGDSVLAGGLGYLSAPGIYRDTLTAANGCDSVVRYSVTVGSASVDTVAVSICDGDAWFASGAFQTNSGTYVDSFALSGACDSVLVTELTVLPQRVQSIVVERCNGDSVFAGGAWQTTAGFYVDTYTGANGCDSTVVTQLQLLPEPVLIRNRQICDGDSIEINGIWQNTTGVYDAVFAGANGCDSIVRTNLVVVPPAFASRTIQLCPGGVTFIGGAPVSAPGMYTDTVPAFSGCDSILTITVVVLPELRDTVDRQICAGDSILAGGSWQSASGEYLDTLVASGGCDSIVLTRLNVVPDSYQELNLLLCSGDSVLLGEGPVAFWTDSSGTYTVNMNSAAGCDSTVRYNVALQPSGRDTLVVQTCAGGGVFAGGAFQTSPGFYTDTLVGAQGCDSVLVTELQLLPTYNDTVSLDACLGDSVFLAGAWQSLPGSYTDFGTTVLGCDSITTTILQFLPEAYDADTLRACLGDSVFLGGAWQSAGGVFVDTISGGASCDTIRSTTLLFIQDSYSQTLLLCEGDSMFVGGAWQDADGLFVDTFANSLGCDSLVFITLLVSPREAYFVERILCAGDSAFLAGNWQSAAGIYVDTFANSLGCDSIITSQLSFTPYYYTQDTITICEGDSIPGIPLTGGSGAAINARRDGSVTYVDTLTASGGCDSLVEITVIEVPSSIGAASITLCAGDSILLGGQWVATPGFYVDTLLNAGGCDSINFVTLSVVDTFQQFFSAEICEGDSVFAGGVWVSTTGLYSDTLTASTGCDSILYLDLTVRPSPVVLLPVELCVGDSVLLLGQWIDGPAVLDDTLSTAFGCDSIRRFVVDTVPVLRNRIDVGICDGDSAFVAGNWENTSGTYSQRFASASGCDSIVTWTLTVYPTYVQGVNVELCAGDSVLAGGAWQTMPGVYADVFTSVRGCDSTVLTTVSVRPSTGSALSASICVGDSAFFAGQWYASPGTYTAVYAAANGCDSVVSFTLTSTSGFDVPITVDACAGDSVFVAGAWQTAAGIYVDSLTANGGCDSVVTSTVVLHPSYADTAALSICAGDSVFLAGAWRSIPGIYTDFGTTVLGCDSSNSVLLEVLPGSGSSTLVEICPGDSVFAGGAWQTASGLYADTLVSALGCDSIASTTILVSPVLTDTVYASVCDGFAYYAGGAWQSTAGVYLDSSLAPGGCLQRKVTVLSIDPSPVVNRSFQICTGDSIYLAGAWRNSNGTYTETTSTVAGCDSVVHNALQVLEPILDTVYTGFCEGDSVFAGGAWQTETGFYTDVYTAASGCDSIVTTALDVAPVFILEIDVELCEGEFFSIGGDSVQVGGEFFMVLSSSQGCDSVLIYDLKFLPLAVNEEARSICEGDSSLVFGQWLSAAGTYSDTVLVPGACPEIERVVLDVRPRVALQAMDTLLCLGDSVQLSTIGGNNWQWAPDEALSCLDCPNPWVAPTSTTVFTVSTTDNCATNPTAEALVEVYPPPSVEAVDEEVVLAPGQSFTLSASGEGNGPLLYWWTAGDQVICTDCPEYTVAPQSGTTYTVWVEDGLGCTASDQLRLGVDDACIDGQFQAANAFSPNGDGFNDRFVIEYSGPATVDWVRIYNRWGELLFETEDPRALWDGHFRGKLVDPGVYVYTLEGTCEGEQPFFFVGNVTMLR